jgi:hypothetical protein
LQGCNPSPYCESTAEEARAGNLQAGFCEGCAPQGARLLDGGWVTDRSTLIKKFLQKRRTVKQDSFEKGNRKNT